MEFDGIFAWFSGKAIISEDGILLNCSLLKFVKIAVCMSIWNWFEFACNNTIVYGVGLLLRD